MILLPIETPVSHERSCLILKPVINENEIEFCNFQKRIIATDEQLFPASGKYSEMGFSTLRWAGWGGQGYELGTICVPDIAPSPAQHLFSKAIPEVQHSGETGKEIQLNFPPIEESGPRENGSGAPWQLFQIPPSTSQGWLDASLRRSWNF